MGDFSKYLKSKVSVDNRALNKEVWNTMLSKLSSQNSILEIGGGTGTMYQRLSNVTTLPHYTLIDQDAELVEIANSKFKSDTFQAITKDLHEIIKEAPQQYDFLIAHAVLDLFDLKETLPQILSLLKPGGYFYFTLNFDGESILEPLINPALDKRIMDTYHQSMDDRIINGKVSGDSKSGRHLFKLLSDQNASVLAMGSSDWVVFPTDKAYPNEESYFLKFILETIFNELKGRENFKVSELENWYAKRLQQVDDGQLLYIAHQIDYFGQIQ